MSQDEQARIAPTAVPSEQEGAQPAHDLDHMMHKAAEASEFLKALAHEHRLLLLCLLLERERSVTELEDMLALRQTTVSQQLARLRFDGLVQARRDGRAVYYSIADDRLKSILPAIYTTFCKGL
jgi:DNA-binding transcriptional ArsR family regulator